jgi:hypothetical protein
MAEVATSTFSCSACGKNYKWKQELAGRKVKCKCGQVVQIPTSDPAAKAAPQEDSSLAALEEMAAAKHVEIPRQDVAPQQEDDLYDIAEPEKPRKAARAAVAVASGGAAVAVPAAPLLGYSRAPVAAETQDDNDPNAIKELYFPIGVFAAGLALSLLQATKLSIITFPFQTAMALVGIRLVFDMILICGGCLAVMGWLEISFGSPGPALLKIAGIALIAAPVASIVSYLIHDPFGIIGIVVAMAVIWILFMKMFDMDIADVRVLTAIVGLVRLWAGYAILALIINGIGISFAGMGGSHLSDAELNADRMISDKLDMGRMPDAKPWLMETTGHCFGRTPNAISMKLADGLLTAGCKLVKVDHDGPFATELVAELPTNDERRKEAFAAANAYCAETGDTAPVDKGQTYLDMDFSMFYAPPTTGPSGTTGTTVPPTLRIPRRRIRF